MANKLEEKIIKLLWSGKMVAVFYSYPANVTTQIGE